MRPLTLILASTVLMATACDSSKDAKPEGKEAEAKKAAGPDYGPIDEKVKAAKTGDDWLQLTVECGKLEMDAAMNGNGKLAEDDEYNKHCGRGLEFARAEQVVAQSTPDKMHTSCLSASMGLESVIEKGKEADKAKELLAKVNTACGL